MPYQLGIVQTNKHVETRELHTTTSDATATRNLQVTYHGWVYFIVPAGSFDNNHEKYSLKTIRFRRKRW